VQHDNPPILWCATNITSQQNFTASVLREELTNDGALGRDTELSSFITTRTVTLPNTYMNTFGSVRVSKLHRSY
jgi:hypothetical protein